MSRITTPLNSELKFKIKEKENCQMNVLVFGLFKLMNSLIFFYNEQKKKFTMTYMHMVTS